MSGKADSKQIKYFAFKEIRCRPHGSHGFNRWTVAVEPHFEPDAFLAGDPYVLADVYESVQVRPWLWGTGRPG